MSTYKPCPRPKMTCRQHEVRATFAQMNAVLGSPDMDPYEGDGKVTAQWSSKKGRDHICAWDYKTGIAPEGNQYWSVWASSPAAFKRFEAAVAAAPAEGTSERQDVMARLTKSLEQAGFDAFLDLEDPRGPRVTIDFEDLILGTEVLDQRG